MALSVLRFAFGSDECYLYDSRLKGLILQGTEEEMYSWKHKMEDAEQKQSNREWLDEVRSERVALLVTGGYTNEQATEFLQKTMPYLFTKTKPYETQTT